MRGLHLDSRRRGAQTHFDHGEISDYKQENPRENSKLSCRRRLGFLSRNGRLALQPAVQRASSRR